MRLLFTFCTLFWICGLSLAQSTLTHYEPIHYAPVDEEILTEIKTAFDDHLAQLSFHKRDETKRAKEFAEGLYNSLKIPNDHGSLSTENPLASYLQGIVDRIASANSLESNYYKVFLSVDDIPNAANYGEGVIVFNLGLLSRLNSEGEIAFILAHEMSHDLKDHVFSGIQKKVIAIESDDYKMQAKEIEKKAYNQRAALIQLYRTYTSEFNEHGRANELEADSLGLILAQKAGFKVEDALSAMAILDVSDQFPALQLDYAGYFNFRSFPFDEKWLEHKKTQNLGGNLDDYIFPDSLKTHPSCKARDSALRIIGHAENYQFDSMQAPLYFSLYEMVQAEQISFYRITGQFAKMLYYSLWQSQVNPKNSYFSNCIGAALYGVYSAQYAHRFSQAVPFPNQKMEPAYAELVGFLHKLNLSNLEQLFHAFTAERIPAAGSDAFSDLLFALSDGIELGDDPEARQELVANYESTYGDSSPFTLYLKNQFPNTNSKRKK